MASITRYYLIVGDMADNGAVIMTGSRSRYHGKNDAQDGSVVFCPVCETSGVLKCVGPRLSNRVDGIQKALSGDICICKCRRPPVFLATRSTYRMTVDTDTACCLHLGGGGIGTTWAESSDKPAGLIVLIKNSETGEPLKNRPYIANINGIQREGRTDANGYVKLDAKEGEIIDLHVVFTAPKVQLIPDLT